MFENNHNGQWHVANGNVHSYNENGVKYQAETKLSDPWVSNPIIFLRFMQKPIDTDISCQYQHLASI